MKNIITTCAVFLVLTVSSFGAFGQDNKKVPDKEKTPKVRVEREKNDEQKNRDREREEREKQQNRNDNRPNKK